MSGLDHLLVRSLNEVIEKNLGSKTVEKINDRLFEKFGISLTQAIEEFDKLDLVLREFFGKGADGIERKIFENIFQSKPRKSKEHWYTLSDSYVNTIILQAYGDMEKKKIIESVSESPKIIHDILKDCQLPRTSGYRKINSLIDDGLIYQFDQIVVDNKKINKYACAFTNLKINIEKNKLTVDVQLSDSDIAKSSIFQTIPI
ncbi:hypothetical protein [Nitrosopumilus ureiphilus]|uniref:Uncharacterized protein n=1 Tax=Nitrosopumilus ureiphilus TaxID=1470067 RepID=A0A7D5M5I0_9ARCH|nr:hypothetical protein [Nitrosopumilus ureiphilus]QLH06915.1 hypothetical protein C5F50_07395 [Nitrosopumilus ureiphilus]